MRHAITLPSLILSITVRLFFGGDIAGPSVGRRLDAISRQIEQLGHDLRIVSETVALQARFQLAVTPSLELVVGGGPARRLYARIRAFDEFAAQVARHVHPGTSLLKEAIERVSARKPPDHLSIRIRQRA
jgi:hypothetical protein